MGEAAVTSLGLQLARKRWGEGGQRRGMAKSVKLLLIFFVFVCRPSELNFDVAGAWDL